MNKTYLSVGKKYTETQEKKDKLDAFISEIEWHDIPKDKISLPFMQGWGIKEMVKQLGNNVDLFGYGFFEDLKLDDPLHGGSVYCIRNNYKTGDVKQALVFTVDDGCGITPVLVIENPDFNPVSVEEKQMDDWDAHS